MESYKAEQEQFHSGNDGATVATVVCVICIAPFFMFFTKLAHALSQSQSNINHHSSRFLREIAFLVMPLVLSMTVLASYITHLCSLLTVVLAVIYAFRYKRQRGAKGKNDNSNSTTNSKSGQQQKYGFITIFKGISVLMTCIAILAVDFPVFPRTLGKTETFGLSLMDSGVGSFIISTALTSKYARTRGRADSSNSSNNNRSESTPVNRVIPLQRWMVLALGVCRMVALKALNYPEHVSEYGVHWNFFVTLFCVWAAADILHACSRSWRNGAGAGAGATASASAGASDGDGDGTRACSYTGELAVVVLVLYQVALVTTPLSDYVMSDVRSDLLSANKEGVVSLLGYIPLYLLAEEVSGRLVFDNNNNSGGATAAAAAAAAANTNINIGDKGGTIYDATSSDKTPMAISSSSSVSSSSTSMFNVTRFGAVCIFFWILWLCCCSFVQPTSRRLVNAAYVFFVLALGMTTIVMVYIADLLLLGLFVANGDIEDKDDKKKKEASVSALCKDLTSCPSSSSSCSSSSSSFSSSSSSSSPSTQLLSLTTLELASKHSLLVFLGANVLTGCINQSIHTIHTDTNTALVVISAYSISFVGAAWLWDYFVVKSSVYN